MKIGKFFSNTSSSPSPQPITVKNRKTEEELKQIMLLYAPVITAKLMLAKEIEACDIPIDWFELNYYLCEILYEVILEVNK